MKIISHRGYWKAPEEKNTRQAFERSFSLGYGTETDIRDAQQELVISHDMPTGGEQSLSALLTQASASASTSANARQLTLALNIKADGLANSLALQLQAHPHLDCFVFDMSIPDMRGYLNVGVPVFTRMSDVERNPVWLDRAAGVWLDAFESEWYEADDIQALLAARKRVCIVSSELHRRPQQALWEMIRPLAQATGLILCTDIPEQATSFFGNDTKE